MAQAAAIVTGASSGIGLQVALGLAGTGRDLILVGRDPARTEAARRQVADRAGGGRIEAIVADFASLAEVRRVAGEILSRADRLELLVNNAGLFSRRLARSADGIELTFAVNHLAPFLLTNLLLDRLRGSAPARIVTVASIAHRGARLAADDITGARDWGMMKAYSRSKLCNILFTRELARRLAGSGIVAACLHPGLVATRIGDRGGLIELFWRLAKPFMISPERGARTPLFLATVPNPTPYHGLYLVRERPVRPDPAALDDEQARRLWRESARLVGLPDEA